MSPPPVVAPLDAPLEVRAAGVVRVGAGLAAAGAFLTAGARTAGARVEAVFAAGAPALDRALTASYASPLTE